MSVKKDKFLKSPYPWFGGKSRVVDEIWRRVGDVDNAIEPFAGSLVWLLRRPSTHKPRIETANDWNAYISNFWRAIQRAPDAVAKHADWIISEADLHARHRWLVLSEYAAEFRHLMRTDPEYFDARVAGWWVWGQCMWIGSGWCDEPDDTGEVGEKRPLIGGDHPSTGPGKGINGTGPSSHQKAPRANGSLTGRKVTGEGIHGMAADRRPEISVGGQKGVNRKHSAEWEVHPDIGGDGGATGRWIHASGAHSALWAQVPHGGDGAVGRGVNAGGRPQLGDAYSRGRGIHGNDAAEVCEARRDWLKQWFNVLSDRIRTWRILCGDWNRVCGSPSVTTRLGVTGVMLDPPYRITLKGGDRDGEKSRDGSIYSSDAVKENHPDKLVDEVQAFCREHGPDSQFRIAVCGLEGEGYEELEKEGWDCWHWKSKGGYANRAGDDTRENRTRERIWFSPFCNTAVDLFAGCGAENSQDALDAVPETM